MQNRVFYGTFNEVCEKSINKYGYLRDLVLNRILVNYPCKIKKKEESKGN